MANVADPTLSHRHAAGAESARGLLFTVLGEFVLPGGGTAWTSAFIDVFARVGVEEKATRQALMRTAADGWLLADRIGRRTRWRLTARAQELLTEGTERIYGCPGVSDGWDGRWLLVLARVPESDRVGEAERLLDAAGVGADARIFVAEHHSGDLASMVRQAWDLDEIELRYQAFLAEFTAPRAADPLADVVALVHAWRRFPWTDPMLPRELLPRRWSGERAAKLFAARHAAWSAGAISEWARVND